MSSGGIRTRRRPLRTAVTFAFVSEGRETEARVHKASMVRVRRRPLRVLLWASSSNMTASCPWHFVSRCRARSFSVFPASFMAFLGPKSLNDTHPRMAPEDFTVLPSWVGPVQCAHFLLIAFRRHEAEWIVRASCRPIRHQALLSHCGTLPVACSSSPIAAARSPDGSAISCPG
ncbi:hypothetical protein PR202_gb12611 [Eleusine coracana subsp. coracana]|uniref:Uncharacterized protein n=1 Tax=Eleusine coracana subsp. coracana TaxID=191504 RepID=A0AAV5EPZ0_ELECO|nr:hypothetical protein PR202_gb12611 [Eleusine coracana subsp. coracana]